MHTEDLLIFKKLRKTLSPFFTNQHFHLFFKGFIQFCWKIQLHIHPSSQCAFFKDYPPKPLPWSPLQIPVSIIEQTFLPFAILLETFARMKGIHTLIDFDLLHKHGNGIIIFPIISMQHTTKPKPGKNTMQWNWSSVSKPSSPHINNGCWRHTLSSCVCEHLPKHSQHTTPFHLNQIIHLPHIAHIDSAIPASNVQLNVQ